jgi:hypothetical protein
MTSISQPIIAHQDISASELVDLALSMPQLFDRDLVATFLLRRGVRFSVVVRVLADPDKRRGQRRPGQVARTALQPAR